MRKIHSQLQDTSFIYGLAITPNLKLQRLVISHFSQSKALLHDNKYFLYCIIVEAKKL